MKQQFFLSHRKRILQQIEKTRPTLGMTTLQHDVLLGNCKSKPFCVCVCVCVCVFVCGHNILTEYLRNKDQQDALFFFNLLQ